MNLAALLPERARELGDQPAVIRTLRGVDVTISFAELDDATAKGAAFLHSAGIKRGDRVLLLIPISIDLYVALLSVLRLGAVVTLLDPSAGLAHIDRCCRIAEPAAMIVAPKARLLGPLCRGLRSMPTTITLEDRWPGRLAWRNALACHPRREIVDTAPDDPALLTFTSGSTAKPKAAMRSHGLLLAQQGAVGAALGLRPGALDLTTLAVFVLNNFACGVTSLLPDADLRSPGLIDPGPVIAQIERRAPESVIASPAFLMRLVERCEAEGRALSSLRRVFTGGAPVFWKTLDAIKKVAPGARVSPCTARPRPSPSRKQRSTTSPRTTGMSRAPVAGCPRGCPFRRYSCALSRIVGANPFLHSPGPSSRASG